MNKPAPNLTMNCRPFRRLVLVLAVGLACLLCASVAVFARGGVEPAASSSSSHVEGYCGDPDCPNCEPPLEIGIQPGGEDDAKAGDGNAGLADAAPPAQNNLGDLASAPQTTSSAAPQANQAAGGSDALLSSAKTFLAQPVAGVTVGFILLVVAVVIGILIILAVILRVLRRAFKGK